MICPMGVNIARGVNVMREVLFEAGLAPLELLAVAQEQAGRGTVFGVGAPELLQAVQHMRDQGIAVPLDEPQAEVLMVTSVIDILLYQDALMATAKILNHLGVKWTLRRAGFEGETISHFIHGEVPARLLTGIELDFPKAVSRL